MDAFGPRRNGALSALEDALHTILHVSIAQRAR
jgi:hypothetical protein